MAIAEQSPAAVAPGWLRDQRFDRNFILGIAAIALLSGWAAVQRPDLFPIILLADLWLLGYHHVISTFTRLCFDRKSFEQHRFLVVWLPLIVFAAVALLGIGVGLWTLTTTYLYWQWFHYTRQSWGIAQAYRRKSSDLLQEPEWLGKATFYALPLYGILYRSYQAPETFIGVELRVVPVPGLAVDIVAALALATLAWWIATRVLAWWQGRLALAHTLYVLSHFVIFYVAYVFIEDITFGWLVVNIWHNAQYIAFVWMFNNRQYKDGIDPEARFLSYLSQNGNAWLYLAVCFGLSTVVYLTIANSAALILPAIVIYQTINFHHYVVDGFIWKMRRKPLQKTLGIASS